MEETRKIIIALKKAQSHLGRVIEMVENGEYCVNVMQQNLAVIGLLKSANGNLLERHLKSCFIQAMVGTDEETKQKMISEVVELNKLSKQ